MWCGVGLAICQYLCVVGTSEYYGKALQTVMTFSCSVMTRIRKQCLLFAIHLITIYE